jgi:hypothetical protein
VFCLFKKNKAKAIVIILAIIKIIDLYQNILTSLYQSYHIKTQLLNEETKSNLYKWAYDTLNDSVKLNEYIEDLKKSYFITSVNVESKYAMLKPQYKKYIELYGLPDNLDFDPDKLSAILNDINMY